MSWGTNLLSVHEHGQYCELSKFEWGNFRVSACIWEEWKFCFSSSTHGVNSSGERLQCRFQLSAATLLWSFLRSPIPGIGKRKFCKCSKLLTIPFKIALKRSQTWWGYSILSCWVLSAFVMKEKKRNLNLKSQPNHCFEGMICVSFPTRCWAFYFSSAWCAILCMAISYTRE